MKMPLWRNWVSAGPEKPAKAPVERLRRERAEPWSAGVKPRCRKACRFDPGRGHQVILMGGMLEWTGTGL